MKSKGFTPQELEQMRADYLLYKANPTVWATPEAFQRYKASLNQPKVIIVTGKEMDAIKAEARASQP